MINIRALEEELVAEDAALRQTLERLVAGASPGEESAALIRILAEGLIAVHERQRTMTLLIARLP